MCKEITIGLNMSIERGYKRANNERTVVSEQNSNLPPDNSLKFKRADLAVTRATLQLSVIRYTNI